jgi:photosystem II stability/assembly factor-like uncharacterized protein
MWGLLVFVLGLSLGTAPWSIPASAAQDSYREPAFQDNFYGVKIRDDRCWIVGYYGTILYSGDRGSTWEIQKSDTKEALFQATFISDQKGWISGSYGTILQTQDGGRNWSTQVSGTREHLFGIDFVSEREGWIVGSQGTLLYTNDGGTTWVSRAIGEDVILNRISFTSSKRGWIVGEFGVIYQTKDGGKSWLKQKSPIEVSFVSGESRNLFALIFPDSQAGWAFGLDGVILRTQTGDQWTVADQNASAPTGVTDRHLFAAAHLDGMLWAVGERGAVIVSEAGKEENWHRANFKFPPVALNAIDFSPDGFGLIVGNRGTIFRTLDGGKKWQRVRIVPQTPGKGISQAR